MPTQTAPVSTAVTFSSEELEMLGDAFAVLFFRAPERRDEIIAFARRRPELQLFYSGPEPELEEDR